MARYAPAIQHPSTIHHPNRDETRGIVIHWTAGHKAGDLAALDGPNVDCHFYVDKDGDVFQFLDTESEAWHAFHTAHHTCIGIEHEGFGEAWTAKQLEASARLVAWLSGLYNIPVRKVDPHKNWHGIFGHSDLKGIDKNDHSDTVPAATGWNRYLKRIKQIRGQARLAKPAAKKPPKAQTLQVILQPKGKPQRAWEGWQNGIWVLHHIAEHGIKPSTRASISLGGQTWKGPASVMKQAKQLVAKYG
jgi:N-acetyl-anhydromuramyl-L-alanine amidase AmpD